MQPWAAARERENNTNLLSCICRHHPLLPTILPLTTMHSYSTFAPYPSSSNAIITSIVDVYTTVA